MAFQKLKLPSRRRCLHIALPAIANGLLVLSVGCRSAAWHRAKADSHAVDNLTAMQKVAFGKQEPINIETPEAQLHRRLLLSQDLPSRLGDTQGSTTNLPPLEKPILLTPETALQIAARNSRDFQQAKETLFKAALDLDLEQDAFRHTFSGILSGNIDNDNSGPENVSSINTSAKPSAKKTFRNGVEMSGSIAVDLVQLLTQGTASSLGILVDASISIPLLRGAGRDIVAEPLRQAEQNLLYAVYTFERFKHSFAVRVISNYISVLQSAQQIQNADQNYKSLITATRRARRLADAGRLPEFQYDQAIQDELRARTRWIDARESLAARMDRFKIELGLPTDAVIELDPATLQRVQTSIGTDNAPAEEMDAIPPADAPVELLVPADQPDDTLGLDYSKALDIALDARLDLRIALAKVEDSRRKIKIAEDNLRAEMSLFGSVQSGERRNSASSAGNDNAKIGFDRLRSSALLSLDLPLHRTAERIAYRKSIIALEEQIRNAKETEDQIKRDIRNAFRNIRLALENLRIQSAAEKLAEKRVHSTDMLLQAGRAQIRDVLEAQEALIGAQNALTSAAVNHRIAILEFQRDLGTLDVSADGILNEIAPLEATPSLGVPPNPIPTDPNNEAL